ncbi:MAG: DUF4389 domain-containing protein [Solirubrobacterales bacterium]|nr:DUF4389 domain-containing protein [Solirubrobacterales bacterium]
MSGGGDQEGHARPELELGTGLPAELRDYPVGADVGHQASYSRFMPLVKWLLAFPHYLVLFVLGLAAALALVVAFFSVLLTRHYPRPCFDLILGTYRSGWRVGAYVYLLVDPYPPFTLGDDPSYPARLEIAYPEGGVDRWRAPFAWLLAIPYLLVTGVLINLTGLLTFFAFFTILFTERYPKGMFELALVPLRWQLRGTAYAHFMVTRYPPIVWG